MSSNLVDLPLDLPADLLPSTDILWSRMAIDRSAGRSNPPVLTSSGQDWQLADLLADLSPQMHHGIYIMGYIWQPFWILQKVGISFYF